MTGEECFPPIALLTGQELVGVWPVDKPLFDPVHVQDRKWDHNASWSTGARMKFPSGSNLVPQPASIFSTRPRTQVPISRCRWQAAAVGSWPKSVSTIRAIITEPSRAEHGRVLNLQS